jgi:hypothetical protein
MKDGSADLCREGEPTELIIDNLRTHPAVRQGCHGSHEVVAIADDPACPQQ